MSRSEQSMVFKLSSTKNLSRMKSQIGIKTKTLKELYKEIYGLRTQKVLKLKLPENNNDFKDEFLINLPKKGYDDHHGSKFEEHILFVSFSLPVKIIYNPESKTQEDMFIFHPNHTCFEGNLWQTVNRKFKNDSSM